MDLVAVPNDSTAPALRGAGWRVRPRISHLLCVCALTTLLLGMTGCGSEPKPPPPDPAMDNAPAPVTTEQPPAQTVQAPQPEPPKGPRRKDGQIFFPQTGWVEEAAFWDMYENRPEEIPDDIDLYAAHELKQEYLREISNPGET